MPRTSPADAAQPCGPLERVDPASGLELYWPLNTLKPLAPDVWIVDDGVVWMAFPGGLSVPFTTRMTILRLATGQLMLISPTSPDDALCEQVQALGVVAHLISPNAIHYVHIAAWKARFPDSVAWASPGVRERAASQGIQVSFDADLADAPDAAWAAQVDQLIMRGSRALQEVVFLHRPSRTLVLTDLIESFEPARLHKRRWRVACCLAGTLDPDGKAPLDMRLSFLGGRAQARACAERMIAWAPERVIVAHGRCFLQEGQRELRRAFRWTGLSAS